MTHDETERDYLLRILEDQFRRHSGFRVDDLYKIVYQATFGGDHFLRDKSAAERMLREEWENLEKVQRRESLLEVIDPRGEVLRVNLRVYRKIGGNPQQMFDIFVRSAEEFNKDRERLVEYWTNITEWAQEGKIPFQKGILEDFFIEMGRKEFPAVHHSESYVDANRPAYRVILKRLWEGFGEDGN